MNAELFPSQKLSEELGRILESKAEILVHTAEEFRESIKERKVEKSLAIIRILLAEIEISEQAVLEGIRFGNETAISRGENSPGGEPDPLREETKEVA